MAKTVFVLFLIIGNPDAMALDPLRIGPQPTEIALENLPPRMRVLLTTLAREVHPLNLYGPTSNGTARTFAVGQIAWSQNSAGQVRISVGLAGSPNAAQLNQLQARFHGVHFGTSDPRYTLGMLNTGVNNDFRCAEHANAQAARQGIIGRNYNTFTFRYGPGFDPDGGTGPVLQLPGNRPGVSPLLDSIPPTANSFRYDPRLQIQQVRPCSSCSTNIPSYDLRLRQGLQVVGPDGLRGRFPLPVLSETPTTPTPTHRTAPGKAPQALPPQFPLKTQPPQALSKASRPKSLGHAFLSPNGPGPIIAWQVFQRSPLYGQIDQKLGEGWDSLQVRLHKLGLHSAPRSVFNNQPLTPAQIFLDAPDMAYSSFPTTFQNGASIHIPTEDFPRQDEERHIASSNTWHQETSYEAASAYCKKLGQDWVLPTTVELGKIMGMFSAQGHIPKQMWGGLGAWARNSSHSESPESGGQCRWHADSKGFSSARCSSASDGIPRKVLCVCAAETCVSPFDRGIIVNWIPKIPLSVREEWEEVRRLLPKEILHSLEEHFYDNARMRFPHRTDPDNVRIIPSLERDIRDVRGIIQAVREHAATQLVAKKIRCDSYKGKMKELLEGDGNAKFGGPLAIMGSNGTKTNICRLLLSDGSYQFRDSSMSRCLTILNQIDSEFLSLFVTDNAQAMNDCARENEEFRFLRDRAIAARNSCWQREWTNPDPPTIPRTIAQAGAHLIGPPQP